MKKTYQGKRAENDLLITAYLTSLVKTPHILLWLKFKVGILPPALDSALCCFFLCQRDVCVLLEAFRERFLWKWSQTNIGIAEKSVPQAAAKKYNMLCPPTKHILYVLSIIWYLEKTLKTIISYCERLAVQEPLPYVLLKYIHNSQGFFLSGTLLYKQPVRKVSITSNPSPPS